jgi:hypothetical protein
LTYDSRLGLRVRKMSAGQSSASYRNQLVWLQQGQWSWPQWLQWRSFWDFHLSVWWLRQRPRQGSTDYGVPSGGDVNPLTLVTPKNLRIWSMNPSYRRGLTGCFRDMFTTSYSWSTALTSVNGRTGSTQTKMGPGLVHRWVQDQ